MYTRTLLQSSVILDNENRTIVKSYSKETHFDEADIYTQYMWGHQMIYHPPYSLLVEPENIFKNFSLRMAAKWSVWFEPDLI